MFATFENTLNPALPTIKQLPPPDQFVQTNISEQITPPSKHNILRV